MVAILHVGAAAETTAIVDEFRARGVDVVAAPPDDLAAALDGRNFEAAVIAPDVAAPLRVARTLHNASPGTHIVFVAGDDAGDASQTLLRRELAMAPRIGTHWSVARPATARDTISEAIDAAARRQRFRTTLDRVNLALARAESTPRPLPTDAFFPTVLDQISDGVVILDSAGIVSVVNEAARFLFGERLRRGSSFAEVIPREGIERAADDKRWILAGARGLLLEIRLTPIRDHERQLIGTAIVARDVTAQRKGELRRQIITTAVEQLSSTLDVETALQRFAEVVAGSIADVVVVDVLEEEGFVRRAAAASHPDDLSFAQRLRMFAPIPGREHPVLAAMERRGPVLRNDADESVWRGIARSEEHAEIFRALALHAYLAIPLCAGNRAIGAMALGRGRSGAKFSEDDVALAGELARHAATAIQNIWSFHHAQEASRSKDEFLATLSHELRTPMTAILGWIQMLRIGDLDSDALRDALQAMERSARVQAQLIDDLLDLSRIQMGKLHLQMTTVDLAAVVRAALETVRPTAQAKDLRVSVDGGGNVPVLGDPNRLQQIVWNLLSNAVKFTDRGGTISILVRREDSHAAVIVRDTGHGIDPEFLPFVFDRFRQADSTMTRRFGGLGLGLSIVRQLVELHGGSVLAESEGPGRGAVFTVRFPIAAARETVPHAPAAIASRLDGVLVLVVEDDPASADVIGGILRLAGAEVVVSASAAAALEEMRRRPPHVLVSDLAMPQQDGYSLIHHVRSTLRIGADRLPAVALTAFSDLDHKVSALGAGFQRFLQKPVAAHELVDAIAGALAEADRN